MKVCYLTWGETPRSYGVFCSQVIEQFVATQKKMSEHSFYFISAVPIIHSGFFREKIKYRGEIKKIKQKLGNIKFISIPIFASQNFVNSSKSTFNFMHYGTHIILRNIFKGLQPDIVHCRSYHAAWAALKVKEKYNFKYKIIFDPRGLWPEEISLKKGFNENSPDYRFLKSIENQLLCGCDLVISVSDTMLQYLKKMNVKNLECIYLSADTKKLRNENDNKDNEYINVGYVGVLSETTWHKPKDLLELYIKIRENVKNTRLFIVTTSSHTDIKKIFSEIPVEELVLISTKSIDELKIVLNKLDFGLMSYFKPENKKDILLAKMVLGVKIAEYLSAGLPIIVNKMCGGASNIIDYFNIGISYDPNSFKEINKENILKFVNDNKHFERNAIAEKLFDYNNNATKYKLVYDRLYKEYYKSISQ